MVGYTRMKKSNAKMLASRMRNRGLEASVYKKKKGYGVSVTRK